MFLPTSTGETVDIAVSPSVGDPLFTRLNLTDDAKSVFKMFSQTQSTAAGGISTAAETTDEIAKRLKDAGKFTSYLKDVLNQLKVDSGEISQVGFIKDMGKGPAGKSYGTGR